MRLGRKHATTANELSGVTKAAVVLLALDRDAAAALLRQMSPETVEKVGGVLASLGEVPRAVAREVLQEFQRMRAAGRYDREGDLAAAESLLRESLDEAEVERMLDQIQASAKAAPFASLQQADSGAVLTFIQDEHPQTIALVLSHLAHDKAAEVLAGLPDRKQIEVVRRVAAMEHASPAVIAQVEQGLEARLSSTPMHAIEQIGGVDTVAEILNRCDRATERVILDAVELDDPDLVDRIRRLMFVFEDVLLVNERGIQAILKEIDNDELCLALRTASDAVKEKFFSNMSARAAELIREDMEYMGPVRLSDVEAAQQRIVEIVRRLEELGELYILNRGGAGDLIV